MSLNKTNKGKRAKYHFRQILNLALSITLVSTSVLPSFAVVSSPPAGSTDTAKEVKARKNRNQDRSE